MSKPEGGRYGRSSIQGGLNPNLLKVQETPKGRKGRQETTPNIPTISSLLPTSLSGLSRGVLYQDTDHVSSNSSSREIPLKSSPRTDREDKSKEVANRPTVPTRVIQKPVVENATLTPSKNIIRRATEEIKVDSFQTPSGKLVRNQVNKERTPLTKQKQKEESELVKGNEVEVKVEANNTEGATEASNKKIQRSKQDRTREIKFVAEKTQTEEKPIVIEVTGPKRGVRISSEVVVPQLQKVEKTVVVVTNVTQPADKKKYQPRGRTISQNPQFKPEVVVKEQVAQPQEKIEVEIKIEPKQRNVLPSRPIPKKQEVSEIKQIEIKPKPVIQSRQVTKIQEPSPMQSSEVRPVQSINARASIKRQQPSEINKEKEVIVKPAVQQPPIQKKQEPSQMEMSEVRPVQTVQPRAAIKRQPTSEIKQKETKQRPAIEPRQIAKVEQPAEVQQIDVKKAVIPSRPIIRKQPPPETKQAEPTTSAVVTTPVKPSNSPESNSRIKPILRPSPVVKTQIEQQQIKMLLTIAPVKVKTGQAESIVVENQVKVEEQKPVLKRTSVVLLTINRLVRTRFEDGFQSLNVNRRNKKILAVNECALLCFAMERTVRSKEGGFIKAFFANLKRHLSSSYANQQKPSSVQSTPAYKSTVVSVLDKLYKVTLREVTLRLSVRRDNTNRKIQIFNLIERWVNKKGIERLSSGFDSIRQRGVYKRNLLYKLAVITQKTSVSRLLAPFSKLVLNSIKLKQIVEVSPTKKPQKSKPKQQAVQVQQGDDQTLIDKLSSLKAGNTSATQEIASLQSKLKEKRKKNESQKASQSQKISQLRQQNEHTKIEIEMKRHHTQQIKTAIDTVNIKPEQQVLLEGEINDLRESKLQLLTNLYISNYKNAEEALNIEGLRSSFDLKEEDSNTVLREWRSISANTELKRLMASYENLDPKVYKARTALIDQQLLVSKLIKSYVKQQYFWEWIHLSAQGV